MKLFLTSSIGGSYKENGRRIPCSLLETNNFLNILSNHWVPNSKCLIISADPEDEVINDSLKAVFAESFRISNFSVSKFDICDVRNENKLADMIFSYDVLLLAGGHVPTQNHFFDRIKLRSLIQRFKGIIIGMSAGTMNCADVVYAQPELDGEAIDPLYPRYLDGLSLTKISILPHFQDIKDISLDGLSVLDDISIPDSKTRPFYALVDGSFVFVNEGVHTLHGEAYWIENGNITKVCDANECLQLV